MIWIAPSLTVLVLHWWAVPHQRINLAFEAFAVCALVAFVGGVMWHSRRRELERERWEFWRTEQIHHRQDTDGI